MADKYAVATGNWSAAGTWAATSGGAPGDGKPGAGDDVFFGAASGAITVTMDEDSAAIGLLLMATFSGTLAMGTWDIPATGFVTLDGTVSGSAGAVITTGDYLTLTSDMDFTGGTAIAFVMNAATGSMGINTNGIEIGALTINDAAGDATFTLQSSLTCGAFVLTDGAFSTDNFALTCTTISGAGGSIAFGASTVNAGANIITLDNITATVGAANITATNIDVGPDGTLTSSTAWSFVGNMTVNGGAYTAGGDLTMVGDFVMTGGAADDGGFDHNIGGDILISGGTLTSTGEWTQTVTGNVANPTQANKFHSFVAGAGVTSTLTDTVWTAKLTPTGNITGAEVICIRNPTAAWWGPQVGTVSISELLIYNDHGTDGIGPGNDMTVDALVLVPTNGAARLLTMDADLTITGDNNLEVTGIGGGDIMTMDMAGHNLTAMGGSVVLGRSSGTGSGVLKLGEGMHSFVGLLYGHVDNTDNALDCEAASVFASGTIDGDNITMTSAGANLHGGTITNADVTGPLHCWGVTDSGYNSVDVLHESSMSGATANVGAGRAA